MQWSLFDRLAGAWRRLWSWLADDIDDASRMTSSGRPYDAGSARARALASSDAAQRIERDLGDDARDEYVALLLGGEDPLRAVDRVRAMPW